MIARLVQYFFKNQCNTPHNKNEGQIQIIISIDSEKVFDKIQNSYRIKTLKN